MSRKAVRSCDKPERPQAICAECLLTFTTDSQDDGEYLCPECAELIDREDRALDVVEFMESHGY